MAIQIDWGMTALGIEAPESYTKIIELNARKEKNVLISAPSESSEDEPVFGDRIVVEFQTKTYLNKQAADNNGINVENHIYKFFAEEEGNYWTQAYNYLKNKVYKFSSSNPIDI